MRNWTGIDKNGKEGHRACCVLHHYFHNTILVISQNTTGLIHTPYVACVASKLKTSVFGMSIFIDELSSLREAADMGIAPIGRDCLRRNPSINEYLIEVKE